MSSRNIVQIDQEKMVALWGKSRLQTALLQFLAHKYQLVDQGCRVDKITENICEGRLDRIYPSLKISENTLG
jgi:hypothetical protein